MSWPMKTLAEVCLPITKADPVDTGRERVQYVDISAVDGVHHTLDGVGWVESAGAPSRCRQVLRSGDTVFSTVRPYLEKIAYIHDQLDGEFASTGFCVLRPNDEVEPRYLFHYATSHGLLDQVLPKQKGVSYPAVLDSEVRACQLPLPPLTEQRRMVAILEEHLSEVDSAVGGLESCQGRLDALRSKTLQWALDRAAEDDECSALTIGELADVGTGTTPLRSNRDFYDGGTIPWITSGDLSAGLVIEPKQYVTALALRETSLRVYPPGTLLVAMYGEGKTRGSVAELGIPATINQACAAIQLRNPEMLGWVRLVLAANYSAMRALASGGVQPNLNLSLVRGIPVPVPSEPTRRRLLGIHLALDDAARRLRLELQEAASRARSLRRALLAAAFSGRLTSRGCDIDVIQEVALEESA